MVKYRLFFGSLMTAFFVGLTILDGYASCIVRRAMCIESNTQYAIRNTQYDGTILAVLIVVIIILATLELSRLAAAKNLRLFTGVSIVASSLMATTWYWLQFLPRETGEAAISRGVQLYLFFLFAFSLLALLLYQYHFYGISAVLANCGVSCFSIVYLGLLGGFVLAIRIDFGLWPFLMFTLVVKSCDIGAYAGGSLFGKHKFSPGISPGKTWEGMVAGVAFAMVVALAFAGVFDIMAWWWAIVFGFCFAFIGQVGDLVESMIKRDAQQKDSANKVPGFGGILDIIDSPLVAAPFGYLFFLLVT